MLPLRNTEIHPLSMNFPFFYFCCIYFIVFVPFPSSVLSCSTTTVQQMVVAPWSMVATAVILTQSWRVTDRCTAAKMPYILIPLTALVCACVCVQIYICKISTCVYLSGVSVCISVHRHSVSLNLYVCVYTCVCSSVLSGRRQGPLLPKAPQDQCGVSILASQLEGCCLTPPVPDRRLWRLLSYTPTLLHPPTHKHSHMQTHKHTHIHTVGG